MLERTGALVCLFLGALQAAPVSTFFEPTDGKFVAISNGRRIEISSTEVRVSGRAAVPTTLIQWNGSARAAVSGQSAGVGVTNYFMATNPAAWRVGTPHYSRVLIADLYPETDVAYYFRNNDLEFDINVRSGGDPDTLRFTTADARPALDRS